MRCFIACEEGQGICAQLLVVFSLLLIFVTLPFSLCFVVKVVQVSCDVCNCIFQMLHWVLISNFVKLHSCIFFSGIWKGCDLSTWSSSHWRSTRSWCFLHHSMCGYLWENWYAHSDLRCASSRGQIYLMDDYDIKKPFNRFSQKTVWLFLWMLSCTTR